jgi:hypothetical protein
MKAHHVMMIGAAVVLIVLTGAGVVGGPLATLLLLGLLLLCPLMMLGMHGDARPHIDRGTDGSQERGSSRERVRRDGR